MFKKLLILLLILMLLSSCVVSRINTLDIIPNIHLPQCATSALGIMVSINSADQRSEKILAKLNRGGQCIALMPSRDVRFLLQEIFEKQMLARGYTVGPNGPINLNIVIHKFYSDVREGNFSHSITTYADIAIIVQADNGHRKIKHFQSCHNVKGVFYATNNKIACAMSAILNYVFNEISNDRSISDFIKQNAY
ncbi:YajG family lipoprotein [Candidatus Curculioniphilus buchneri]|uniref:YajG family lipoprotein n=1 Tax=Candidatus Curculioniphilus buchneri TaxID=690594 RepID=UPI00376EA4AD